MDSLLFPFRRNSLRFKLFLLLSLLTLVIIVSLSLLYAWREVYANEHRTADKADILASSLANSVRLPLYSDDREGMAFLVTEAARVAGVDAVTVFKSDGTVAVRAGKPQTETVNNRIRSEAPVLSSATVALADGLLEPSPSAPVLLGWVRVSMGNEELQEFLHDLVATTIVSAVAFWVVVSLISLFIVQWFTRSLAPLIDGLKVMQQGDYGARIVQVGADELTEASAAVNDLAAALQQRAAENDLLRRDLEISRAHMQTLLDNLPMAVWLKDTEGRYLTINAAYIEEAGRPREAIVNRTDLELWPREQAEKFRNEDLDVMSSRNRLHLEQQVVTAKGSYWAETFKSPVVDNRGDVVGAVGVSQNITERKQAAELLRKSEERFRSIMALSPDIISILADDGTLTYNSPAALPIHGYSDEELVGQNSFDRIHPDDQGSVAEIFAEILRDPSHVRTAQYRYRNKDGSYTWMEAVAANQVTNPSIMGVLAISRDITVRKRIEEELQEEKSLLRCLIDSLNDLIYIKDRNGVYLACNKASENFLGISEKEQIGRTDFDFFDLQIAEMIRAADEKVLVDNIPHHSIDLVPTIDGRMLLLDTTKSPFFTPDGTCRGLVGISRDITELKRAEEALRTSEISYRRLHESMRDAFVKVDMQGTIIECNRMFEELIGYSAAELARLTYVDFTPSAWHAWESRLIAEQVLPRGYSEVYEKEYIRKDGAIIPVELRTYLLRDQSGQPEGMWAFIRDITERKRIEAELLQAQQKAEAANQAKSKFLANVSHEIRTPMTAIIGLGHLALKTDLTPKQRDYLTKLATAADDLLLLLNEILDFSKIEAGKLFLETVPFALRTELAKIVTTVEEKAAAKHLRLQIGVTSATPDHLVGDPFRLRQVLLNLLTNAVKFTDQGEIDVSIRAMEVTGGDVTLECSVRDTGIGMDEQQIAGIFDPFTQADSSTTRRFGGTGLGLSICRELVGLMGGSIQVASVPGVGSIFTFTARFIRGNAAEKPAEPVVAKKARTELRGRRVLVVDDQPVNLQVTQEALEQVGVLVTLANDGQEAVRAVQETGAGFDLVLMDIQMPNLDGYQATRRIREQWRADRLPIIAMTAHAGNEERERCLAAGMNAHLVKPVRPNQLYACLEQWLSVKPGHEIPTALPGAMSQGDLPERLPGFDLERGLDLLDCDPASYRRFILSFARHYRETGLRLREAMARSDLPQVEHLAHALRGASGNLAAVALHVAAGELESVCAQGFTEQAAQLVPLVVERLAEVIASADSLA